MYRVEITEIEDTKTIEGVPPIAPREVYAQTFAELDAPRIIAFLNAPARGRKRKAEKGPAK